MCDFVPPSMSKIYFHVDTLRQMCLNIDFLHGNYDRIQANIGDLDPAFLSKNEIPLKEKVVDITKFPSKDEDIAHYNNGDIIFFNQYLVVNDFINTFSKENKSHFEYIICGDNIYKLFQAYKKDKINIVYHKE